MLKVKDVMTSELASVPPLTPVIEVAHQMKVSGRGVIPVCDNGKFRGVITERDIVIGVVATATDPVTEPARSVMNNHLPLISPGDEIMQAAKVMVDNGARVLPVAQNGKLLGLFTLDDLARESLGLAAMVFSKTVKLSQRRGDDQ